MPETKHAAVSSYETAACALTGKMSGGEVQGSAGNALVARATQGTFGLASALEKSAELVAITGYGSLKHGVNASEIGEGGLELDSLLVIR